MYGLGIYLLILIIFVLSTNIYSMGTENYYDLRISKQVVTGDFYDDISDRTIKPNPYHFVLGWFVIILGDVLAIKVLPLILSIGLALMVFLWLKKLDKDTMPFILSVFVLSPIFIKSLFVTNASVLALIIMLFGLYYLDTKKSYFLLLIPFFPIINTLVLFMFLLLYYRNLKNKNYFFIFLLFLLSLFYHANFYFSHGISSGLFFLNISLIHDFGSFFGFSVFTLLLVLYYLSFSNKSKLLLLYLLLLSSLAFLIGNDTLLFANLLVAYFGGLGLYNLFHSNWELKDLKKFSILATIFGILFSSMFINSVSPSDEIINGSFWLKNNVDENDIILSSPENGFWIRYFSDRKVVLDGYISPYYLKKLKNSNEFFHTRNLKNAKSLANDLNFTYVFIDENMKSSLWKKKDSGLLFLLRNNETFEKVYDDGMQIWKIKRDN